MTNKLKYFIGNWKMFGDLNSLKIVNQINQFYIKHNKKHRNYKIILCVPNTLIYFFAKNRSMRISIGAQNSHENSDYGPFTGSVNSSMLKNVGAQHVILGHSENRAKGETNQILKKKVLSALNKKVGVIFCFGEKIQDKKKGQTFSVIKKQINQSISKKLNFKKIIFAYEPVWSIGTNKIPKKHELNKIFKFIKKMNKKNFGKNLTSPVLYGGSVNSKNVKIFSHIPEIDGFLIGGASQNAKKFIDIIKNYYK